MTGPGRPATVTGSADDDTARNLADALTYLARVVSDAGYHSVAVDILALRDRMNCIAKAEEARREGGS
jgi:hypothetical protein